MMKTPCTIAVVVTLLATPAMARADVVLDWNAIATSVPNPTPFPQARVMAITQLAVFEAVNAIKRGYEPYLGTVNAAPGASADAAVIAAAHDVLKFYAPGSSAMLDAAKASSLAGIPDGAAKAAGIATRQGDSRSGSRPRSNSRAAVSSTNGPKPTLMPGVDPSIARQVRRASSPSTVIPKCAHTS